VAVRVLPKSAPTDAHRKPADRDDRHDTKWTVQSRQTERRNRGRVRPGACGADIDLALVSSTPLAESTGNSSSCRRVRVAFGRLRQRSGDAIDAKRSWPRTSSSSTSRPSMPSSGRAAVFGQLGGARLLRIGAGQRGNPPPRCRRRSTPSCSMVRARGASTGRRKYLSSILVPLDGRQPGAPTDRVRSGAVIDGAVVGVQRQQSSVPATDDSTSAILLVDAGDRGTPRESRRWSPCRRRAWARGVDARCDVSVDRPCTLVGFSLANGAKISFPLPRSPGFTAECRASPDGHQLAFTLVRAGQDPRYEQGHPIPPADIVVVELDTGRLDVVPASRRRGRRRPGWLSHRTVAGS
jgi:hypothetical protein